ncbi:MAG: hypothetical protein EAZ73_09285 [Oscillatoriales cyanobacterium]|uniref:hypothetical protein n=1 Tax=unclassified Microcoleus TaxID=2642155 RepID=UPI001D2E727C|nr:MULTISPECIES: hypothetical protein [unclassified Microcoleus]TAF00833.1 MAG: hypothetical protein EAZ79_01310 [Oscillatoriales cyanobacterium]MCC3459830.1 hypothetical protein [Microcoleus sp. PH2017_11_PCY_U_A]MCC3478263.1 hypothetical protein [Microcoleus sp. PH2017_12_PCY_D_A]TAF21408.1 MAG: hypothetical protein EAZ73_09285 [Oscillatoriales cyanobacterium]TAF39665.1 MAG: hypothetical protein EAZ69_00060 [Oscillatoriales cyanobacterium]
MILQPTHAVTIVRAYNPDIKMQVRGRTVEEAIARTKGGARDMGYWDCTAVVPNSDAAPPRAGGR